MTVMAGPAPRIVRDADLTALNTFGVAARAPWLVEVDDAATLPAVLATAPLADTDPLVLGGGSNVLFVDNPGRPVLRLTGRSMRIVREDAAGVLLFADAGVDWHRLVVDSLAMGLCGLENLALIPGTVGASPIQNIGAYGVEVCQRIDGVHVHEPATGESRRLAAPDCAFAYRDSLFKREPGRYIVTGVDFLLQRTGAPTLAYAGLADELAAMGVDTPTASDVAAAVVAIRRRKLPDPAVVGNAGSFFKNPIVDAALATGLLAEHPRLPVFPAGDGLSKLSAAWLIDSLGFKGAREGDAGIAASHALVLVNHGHASGRQLLDLAMRVAAAVHGRYHVMLEPEPRLVGATWSP